MLLLAYDCTKDTSLLSIIKLLKLLLQLIQLLVPIGLIIMGSIDLGKAVISSDEKKIAENQKLFLKRVIAAILVFLVVTIVSFAMGFVGGVTGNSNWQDCWKAVNTN